MGPVKLLMEVHHVAKHHGKLSSKSERSVERLAGIALQINRELSSKDRLRLKNDFQRLSKLTLSRKRSGAHQMSKKVVSALS